MLFLFANTGQEHPATLDFVDQCSKRFGFPVVWLEADVNMQHRKPTLYKVVDHTTADRSGAPFESVIQKYGIPNANYPHCSRELKMAPIHKYAKDAGYGEAPMAVGIRLDEIDRMSDQAERYRLVYPLISWHPVTKKQVMKFWSVQDFDLQLPERFGNCVWCWKKSDKKHRENFSSNPEWYNFPARMESLYDRVKVKPGATSRVFFRGRRSTAELLASLTDDDTPNGCGDECNPFVGV